MDANGTAYASDDDGQTWVPVLGVRDLKFKVDAPKTAQRINATAAEDAMRAMNAAERAQMRKLIDDGLIELVLDERPVVYTGRAARRAAERRRRG